MITEIDSSNPVVKAVIEGTAPRSGQFAASRGILPLPLTDMLEMLVAFAKAATTSYSRTPKHR